MIPTAAFLLNPSALTASYKQLTKNYNVQSREILVIAMVSPRDSKGMREEHIILQLHPAQSENGSCVLTATEVKCWSKHSIDTLNWHSIDISVDTRTTLHWHLSQQSVKSQLILSKQKIKVCTTLKITTYTVTLQIIASPMEIARQS